MPKNPDPEPISSPLLLDNLPEPSEDRFFSALGFQKLEKKAKRKPKASVDE
jgi:hypothetical protein